MGDEAGERNHNSTRFAFLSRPEISYPPMPGDPLAYLGRYLRPRLRSCAARWLGGMSGA